jgi:hypothetical protein
VLALQVDELVSGERESDGQQRQHCPNDHDRHHQKCDGSCGESDLIEERHRGAYRHGVYQGHASRRAISRVLVARSRARSGHVNIPLAQALTGAPRLLVQCGTEVPKVGSGCLEA